MKYDLATATATMKAVVTTGHGGYERLDYRDVPLPQPRDGEVLLQVLAAGVNNTEINTRLGWYSTAIRTGTAEAAASVDDRPDPGVGGWRGETPFPFIQGTDCCGRIVAVGGGIDPGRIGERVLVRACMRRDGFGSMETVWMGSDFDGSFAEYVRVPASEAFAVHCTWSDVELGSIPCAYGTAENMLHRAQVVAGERVLVTGASGGVGSAAVQLARRRGAVVIALAGAAKAEQVRGFGATTVLDRDADVVAELGGQTVDCVVDNVAGPGFGGHIGVLRRGGRYVSSGAIGGPEVALDMRTFYLRDLTLLGCTAWDEPVFPNLVGYIERGEIRPLVAATFPLRRIADAQRVFLEKKHAGKIVLVP